MDLGLVARVTWRFKWIAALGFVAACFLAVYSTASISFVDGGLKVAYRTPAIYSAQTRVLVTQSGFPWGRTILPSAEATSTQPTYADPSRFSLLAGFYASLVNGDKIQREVVRPLEQEVLIASAEVDPRSNDPSPIIDLTALAPSPRGAARLASAGATALQTLVSSQQKQADIPREQRVLLQILQEPTKVTIAVPHKKTVPMVVFVAVMLVTFGLILALENLRPVVRSVDVAAIGPTVAETSRSSRPAGRRSAG